MHKNVNAKNGINIFVIAQAEKIRTVKSEKVQKSRVVIILRML